MTIKSKKVIRHTMKHIPKDWDRLGAKDFIEVLADKKDNEFTKKIKIFLTKLFKNIRLIK